MFCSRDLLLVVFVSFCCMYGCATLRYPPVQEKLFAWQIHKDEVALIKSAIMGNGYKRISLEDYFHRGAFVTKYERMISSTQRANFNVLIILSFKEAGAPSGFYRNLGISIVNLEQGDLPEITTEVNRIEEILYEKLIEVAGKGNVVRGERRESDPEKPGFYPLHIPQPRIR